MTTSQPLVSIILPTLNCQRYLRGAIESVLSQTYSNWELIIIDASSTDGTRAIIEEFAKEPRTRSVTQTTKGLGGARNEAVEGAKGELIAFIDADDLWLPEKLAAHVARMQNASCSVTFSGWSRI